MDLGRQSLDSNSNTKNLTHTLFRMNLNLLLYISCKYFTKCKMVIKAPTEKNPHNEKTKAYKYQYGYDF